MRNADMVPNKNLLVDKKSFANIFQRAFTYLKAQTYFFPLVLLVVMVFITFLLQPLMFQKVRQLNSNLRTMIPLMFLAVGQGLVIINGSIDLSIGPLMSLVAAVMVTNLLPESSVAQYAFIVGLGLGVGLLAGAFNGTLVSWVRLPAFITTYATGYIFNGIALTLLPRPGGHIPDSVATFYRGAIPMNIPMGVWLAGITLAIWGVVSLTRFRTYLYAVGGDPKAAYSTGVPVVKNRLITYTVAGGLAAVAAVFLTLITGSSDSRVGDPMTLDSVVAVVLGGTPMSGGVGGIAGSIFGVFILGFIRNVVSFLRINSWFQPLVDAAIVLIAIATPGIVRLFRKQTIL
jgi:ribose transport system permease protein